MRSNYAYRCLAVAIVLSPSLAGHGQNDKWSAAMALQNKELRLPASTLGGEDSNEPNDTFEAATSIACPGFTSIDTTIDAGGDVDFFLLTGTPSYRVTIDIDASVLGSTLDSVAGVFDSFTIALGFSDDDRAPGEGNSSDSYLETNLPPDGELFVAVASYADFDFDGGADSFFSGPYTLRVNCSPPPSKPQPGDLLASTGNRGDALIDIDRTTGLGSFRSPQGAFGAVTELEFAATGNLIGATGGGADRLINIAPTTGTESLRCNHLQGALNGLEYIDDTLYASWVPSGGGVAPSQLVIVDAPDGSPGNCAITMIGATGFNNIGGLAYQSDTDTLFACTAGSAGGELLTCDRTSGACTSVGPTGYNDCSALEFGPDDVLYAGVGGTQPPGGSLLSIDPANGGATLIGSTGFPVVSGLAFVPFVDSDADGVQDFDDNCVLVSNADQRDTDGDFIGNVCDTDLDDDCVINASDLGLIRNAFFGSDPDADFNGDGIVNVQDLGIMKTLFFSVPGPSGIPNLCSEAVNIGQFAVSRNVGFDLDSGMATPGTGTTTLLPPADIWFEPIDAKSAVLRPLNEATVVIYGPEEPTVLDCIGAPLSAASIDLELIDYTTYLCARTQNGRISRFQIIDSDVLPLGSANQIDVTMTTW